nr:glucokinase [Ensifer sp. ENS09]
MARQAIVAEIGETHTRLAVTDYDRLSIDHYVQFENDAFSWLARFAGDIALLYDARGGIYLWGAIPRRMERRLRADLFRAAFEAKGRRSAWLAEIPIFIIRSDDAILKGAALALSGRLD